MKSRVSVEGRKTRPSLIKFLPGHSSPISASNELRYTPETTQPPI